MLIPNVEAQVKTLASGGVCPGIEPVENYDTSSPTEEP